jgi:hypothetical protein
MMQTGSRSEAFAEQRAGVAKHTHMEYVMKIIQRREYKIIVSHTLFFDGYSFGCDENGIVDESTLQPLGLENYHKCIAKGLGRYERHERGYSEPAIGKCSCGKHVTLANFTNTCSCGTDYNSSGQTLACRSQWGEETGEHWTDCY